MSQLIEFVTDRSSANQVFAHLSSCEHDFIPSLGSRVDLVAYAEKLALNATRFEAWRGEELVGLVAVYCDVSRALSAFVSSVSVQSEWARQGVATTLFSGCLAHCRQAGMREVRLDVAAANRVALRFYEKFGFEIEESDGEVRKMFLQLQL